MQKNGSLIKHVYTFRLWGLPKSPWASSVPRPDNPAIIKRGAERIVRDIHLFQVSIGNRFRYLLVFTSNIILTFPFQVSVRESP